MAFEDGRKELVFRFQHSGWPLHNTPPSGSLGKQLNSTCTRPQLHVQDFLGTGVKLVLRQYLAVTMLAGRSSAYWPFVNLMFATHSHTQTLQPSSVPYQPETYKTRTHPASFSRNATRGRSVSTWLRAVMLISIQCPSSSIIPHVGQQRF
jgi:hypothetical protein